MNYYILVGRKCPCGAPLVRSIAENRITCYYFCAKNKSLAAWDESSFGPLGSRYQPA